MESCSVVQCIRRLVGQSLYCLAADFGMLGREAVMLASPTMCDLVVLPCFHGCLVLLHRHFHHSLLLHLPSIHLSMVNSSPRPGISPQSLSSSSQLLHLPGDLHPCPEYIWLWQVLSDSHSILGCHRSAVSLSDLNISPLIQTIALMWGWDPCFSSPTH